MEMKEFAEQIKELVKEKLGDQYRVELHEVRKNNNVKRTGVVIYRENQNVSPTIYLDSFFEVYENGTEPDTIAESVLHMYESGLPEQEIDMSFFQDYQQVRERICYRLIHYERNREFLENVPYIPYLDLAIVFFYAYEGEQIGKGTIAICNSHLKMWNVGVSQVYEAAKENTPRLYPPEILPMTDVLTQIMQNKDEIDEDFPDTTEEDFSKMIPMQILSNTERFLGAACILYPEILQQTADEKGEGFFILPSSIHEGATC